MLQDGREKSYAFNFIDTPGHPNFNDEVAVALRLADNVLLVVDVIEGLGAQGERLIHQIMKAGKQIVVVLNKLDRLVMEVKLPPVDGYHKIHSVLDEINICVQGLKTINPEQKYLSPLHGNVVFATTLFGACFTLETFAEIYRNR